MLVDARGHETSSEVTPITERQHKRQMAMNATLGDVNEIAHAHAVQATNYLANQIPGLIHTIITQALQGYHESLIVRGVIPPDTPIGQYVEPVINGSVEAARAVETSELPTAPEWT